MLAPKEALTRANKKVAMSEETQEMLSIPIIYDDESPPHWAMVELNGELIAPTEFPTDEVTQVILGKNEGLVELGQLQMTGDNVSPGCPGVLEPVKIDEKS